MTVNGIDVASHQSSDYSTAGLDFVFVKATEGHSYTNPKHAAQVATARAAGLLVGHYHFARAGSMSAQADYFLAHARPAPGDVLAFDWEDAAVSAADKDAWLRYVKRKAPEHRLVLYCGLNFWHRDTTSYCADGLWIADPSAPKSHPRVEHPWLFHQYSEAGGLDHNAGNFTDRAALHHWAGSTRTPAQEDDMPLTPDDIKLLASRDGIWLAPKDAADYNPDPQSSAHYWTLQSHVTDTTTRVRRIDKSTAAMTAQLGALTAAVTALAAGGGLTAEQITAAAQAGAQAALAQLGSALTKED